jgi:hypothetical protein
MRRRFCIEYEIGKYKKNVFNNKSVDWKKIITFANKKI